MATATQAGVNNSISFKQCVRSQGTTEDTNAVENLLKAQDWEGVVNYARSFRYYNIDRNPFTGTDVNAGLNPWMFLAIPEDYSEDAIKGSMVAIRPYSQVGFGILRKGGIATLPAGDVLATDGASTDAGTPVGSPYTVPFTDGTKSQWILSQTTTGKLAFFKGSTCYFVLASSGTVWTKQYSDMKVPPLERSDGNLISGDQSNITVGNDIVTTFVNYAAESWSVAETDEGNLVFRTQSTSGSTTIMIIAGASGLPCNGRGAVYKTDDFKISWQWYVDYLLSEFTNYTSMGIDWVTNIANTATSWMKDATMDAWGWVQSTSSEAWSDINGAWNTVQSTLEQGLNQMENALNPTKW